jgi:hypothetical protein
MPDETDGTFAALSLIGRSLGFDYFPLPRGDSRAASLLDVPTAVEGVCRSLDAPRKLNLLSHCCPRVDKAAVEPIARSLIRDDLDDDPETYKTDLLDRAYKTRPGADPYGRRFASTLSTPAGDALVQEAQDTLVSVAPTCTATTQIIGGVPALSLSTTVVSRQPFEQARAMTDPLFWDDCPPQSDFFTEMKVLEGPTPLPYPDTGWRARILEVVDFSYGHDPSGDAKMFTELDFVFFETELAAGCTYELHRSENREILVDRGFVMVEDLKSIDLRRTTTLKQVYFRTRSNPGDVCRFWSLAQGMVSTSCSTQHQPV